MNDEQAFASILTEQFYKDESSRSCIFEEQLCSLWKYPQLPVTLQAANRSPLQNIFTSTSDFSVHTVSQFLDVSCLSKVLKKQAAQIYLDLPLKKMFDSLTQVSTLDIFYVGSNR